MPNVYVSTEAYLPIFKRDDKRVYAENGRRHDGTQISKKKYEDENVFVCKFPNVHLQL